MVIENEFDVAATPDEVLDLMLDVERVAPCLPGTQVLGKREDGGYDGEMSVKLGPMKMKYRGTVEITEQDQDARTAIMLAKGTETKGQGSAQGTLSMAVGEAQGGGSHVKVATDLKITGRVAQMGHGIMQDVSTRMIGEMASNMEAVLTAGNAEPATADEAAGSPSRAGSGAVANGAEGSVPPPGQEAASEAVVAPSSVKFSTIVGAVIKGRWAAFRAWLKRLFSRGA